MKNKFLLLGATAILSTGAVYTTVKADQLSATIPMSVKIARPMEVNVRENLNFGTIALRKGQADTIEIPANGGDIIATGKYMGGANRALVDIYESPTGGDGAEGHQLVFPTENIPLTYIDGNRGEVSCGTVSNFSQYMTQVSYDGDEKNTRNMIYVGATFTTTDLGVGVSGVDVVGTGDTQTCTGSVVATVVMGGSGYSNTGDGKPNS